MAAITLSYCSLGWGGSASCVSARCWAIEKVPRMPQAAATVSEMARISRTAIERILNMRRTGAPGARLPQAFHELFNKRGSPVELRINNSLPHRRRCIEMARQDRLAGVFVMG